MFHARHRVSHEVTLIAGESFPRCAECGSDVRFELIAEAQQALRDADFRIRLYEVPHPKVKAVEETERTG